MVTASGAVVVGGRTGSEWILARMHVSLIGKRCGRRPFPLLGFQIRVSSRSSVARNTTVLVWAVLSADVPCPFCLQLLDALEVLSDLQVYIGDKPGELGGGHGFDGLAGGGHGRALLNASMRKAYLITLDSVNNTLL